MTPKKWAELPEGKPRWLVRMPSDVKPGDAYYSARALMCETEHQRRATRFYCHDCAIWCASAMDGRVVRLVPKKKPARGE